MDTKNATPAHRPSLYQPQYCQQLVAHMDRGFSFESFAATIDVGRSTLYHWMKQYSEFADAQDRGIAKYINYWENIARDGYGSMPPSMWRWHMARIRRMYRTDMEEEISLQLYKAKLMAEAKAAANQVTEPTVKAPVQEVVNTAEETVVAETEAVESSVVTEPVAPEVVAAVATTSTNTAVQKTSAVAKFIKKKGKVHKSQQHGRSRFY
jgi:hypothetical protein